MTDGVDPDRLALARGLSTQAGMLLEDASAQAVLVGRSSVRELRQRVIEVRSANRNAETLLAAAASLLDG
ncbi:MAG: hypothetical protein ACT4N8_06285 [Sphingosinicella sp.]